MAVACEAAVGACEVAAAPCAVAAVGCAEAACPVRRWVQDDRSADRQSIAVPRSIAALPTAAQASRFAANQRAVNRRGIRTGAANRLAVNALDNDQPPAIVRPFRWAVTRLDNGLPVVCNCRGRPGRGSQQEPNLVTGKLAAPTGLPRTGLATDKSLAATAHQQIALAIARLEGPTAPQRIELATDRSVGPIEHLPTGSATVKSDATTEHREIWPLEQRCLDWQPRGEPPVRA